MTLKANKEATDRLVERLRSRDTAAMSVLYDLYSVSLYNVIYRIVRNPDQAEDLLQESFMKVWLNIDSYDAGKGSIFTWMLNICRNLCIDYLRSKNHSVTTKTVTSDKGVSFYAEHAQVSQPDYTGLKDLVLNLPPEQQQIIDILYFSGYTQSEAAEELNIPLGTIKTRARAAMKGLRCIFKIG